jgi:tyrosyl-tRNA synthetase
MDEIRRLEALPGAQINEAKIALAFEATRILHGVAEAEQARKTAQELFSGGGSSGGGNEPEVEVDRGAFGEGMPVIDLLVTTGIFASKSEARRMIEQGGVVINDKIINDFKLLITSDWFDPERGCLVRKGKKHYYRLRI